MIAYREVRNKKTQTDAYGFKIFFSLVSDRNNANRAAEHTKLIKWREASGISGHSPQFRFGCKQLRQKRYKRRKQVGISQREKGTS